MPQGATKTNAACRQIYPIVIGAIKAWNDASVADSRSALQSAALGLSKAAESAPTLAKGSGDARLISLTADVSARLKGVVTSYANEEAVDGGPLTESADALWAYCGSGR